MSKFKVGDLFLYPSSRGYLLFRVAFDEDTNLLLGVPIGHNDDKGYYFIQTNAIKYYGTELEDIIYGIKK